MGSQDRGKQAADKIGEATDNEQDANVNVKAKRVDEEATDNDKESATEGQAFIVDEENSNPSATISDLLRMVGERQVESPEKAIDVTSPETNSITEASLSARHS